MSSTPRDSNPQAGAVRLSYKFQRLREQIRQAIRAGEFGPQLPGERELGRRFNANAKTINKALADLTNEGLLVRKVGRGTFLANDPATAGIERVRRYACLCMDAGASGYRASMMEAIRRNVEARGHQVTRVCVEATADGSLPTSAWSASTRSATDGLLAYPLDPLGGGPGRPGDALIAEAYRRHVPLVQVGALSESARLHAVIADYADAGCHLAVYLLQSGCEALAVVGTTKDGREGARILAGAQGAASRFGAPVTSIRIGGDGLAAASDGPQAPVELPTTLRARFAEEGPHGLICVGAAALRALLLDADVARQVEDARVVLTAVLEPGDTAAEAAGVTSYEVDPAKVAGWAARLLLEAKPAQMPTEVIVPGVVRVRRAGRQATEGAEQGARKGLRAMTTAAVETVL